MENSGFGSFAPWIRLAIPLGPSLQLIVEPVELGRRRDDAPRRFLFIRWRGCWLRSRSSSGLNLATHSRSLSGIRRVLQCDDLSKSAQIRDGACRISWVGNQDRYTCKNAIARLKPAAQLSLVRHASGAIPVPTEHPLRQRAPRGSPH